MDLRTQLDRDVVSFRHKTTELKLQTWPRRGHVSCIPEEILAQIFIYFLPETLAIDDNLHFTQDWSLHKRRRHDDLVAITHVCSTWRKICLSMKSFWDLIWISDDDVSRSRAEILIERSDGRPLEIAVHDEEAFFRMFGEGRGKIRHLTGPLFEPVLALQMLFPQGPSRIKTLKISSMRDLSHDMHPPTFFSMPAPVLESFILDTDAVFRLPSTLFANHTPKLRKLAMCNVVIPWSSSVFKNLTSMRLECFELNSERHEMNCRVEVHRLLEIVRDCPNLITLVLNDVGPIGTSDLSKTTTPDSLKVSALHLAIIHVRFDQELAHFFMFLDGLYTPNLRHLYVAHPGPCVDDVRRILPMTFTFVERLNMCNCLHLVIDPYHLSAVCKHFLVDDLDARLSGNQRQVSLRYLIKKSSFKSHVHFVNNDHEHDEAELRRYERFLPSFFHRLSPIPERIRALSFRIEPESDAQMSYRDIFRIFCNVQCIEVHGSREDTTLEGFPGFLRQSATLAKENGNVPALHSVQMIIFDNVEFDDGELVDICHFLVHRMQQKAPLLYLGLHLCGSVDARLLPVLRVLVKDLFVSGGGYLNGVDGDEGEEDEEDEESSEDDIDFI